MLHLFKNFRIAENVKAIVQLSRVKTPFLDSFKAGPALDQEKMIWYESVPVSDEGKITSALDGTTKTLSVNAELASFVVQGHILMLGSEQMMVDSADTTANTITVKARGYGSTPVTTHAANDIIYVLAKAEADGKITEDFKKIVKVERQNYLQEFTDDVFISARDMLLKHKDYVSLKGEEELAKTDKQRKDIEKQAIYGVKNFDSVDGRHSMDGVKQSISSAGGVILDASKDLTEDKFSNFLVSLAMRGSNVNKIWLNPATKEVIFRKFKNTVYETKDGQDKQVGGGNMVGYIANALDGRMLEFVVGTSIKTSDMFFIDDSNTELSVAQNGNKDILLDKVVETDEDSSKYKSTIRTIGTTMIKEANKMGFISNIQ